MARYIAFSFMMALCVPQLAFAQIGQSRTERGAVACPRFTTARVDTRLDFQPVQMDLSKSTRDLQRFNIDTLAVRTNPAAHVGGLMQGGIEIASSIDFRIYGDDITACLAVQQMNVTIRIKPTIFVANEYPQGTCRYNAILQHEYFHVAADQEVARDHAPTIRAALEAAARQIGTIGPINASQIEPTRKQISDALGAVLDTRSNLLYKDRQQRQQAIDNPREYARVAALCRGR